MIRGLGDTLNRAATGTGDASLGNAVTDELGRSDFLQLLIAELRNQDPFAPKDDIQFIAELAQFSSLEQLQKLTRIQGDMQLFQAASQSAALIGRSVDAILKNPITGEETPLSGVVTEVRLTGVPPTLMVDGVEIEFSDVQRVY